MIQKTKEFRINRVKNLCAQVTKSFTAYLSYKTEYGISEKTINNHLGCLNTVYNYLESIGEISSPNPLAKIKPIKIDEKELSWLTIDQIKLSWD